MVKIQLVKVQLVNGKDTVHPLLAKKADGTPKL